MVSAVATCSMWGEVFLVPLCRRGELANVLVLQEAGCG